MGINIFFGILIAAAPTKKQPFYITDQTGGIAVGSPAIIQLASSWSGSKPIPACLGWEAEIHPGWVVEPGHTPHSLTLSYLFGNFHSPISQTFMSLDCGKKPTRTREEHERTPYRKARPGLHHGWKLSDERFITQLPFLSKLRNIWASFHIPVCLPASWEHVWMDWTRD